MAGRLRSCASAERIAICIRLEFLWARAPFVRILTSRIPSAPRSLNTITTEGDPIK